MRDFGHRAALVVLANRTPPPRNSGQTLILKSGMFNTDISIKCLTTVLRTVFPKTTSSVRSV